MHEDIHNEPPRAKGADTDNDLLFKIAWAMWTQSPSGGGAPLTDTQLRASPVPVTDTGATPAGNNNIGDVDVLTLRGAANLATSQVAASTTAATLAVARPTRRSILLRNLDTTITVYVGPATVSASNGMLLKAGESCAFTWVGLIQVIAASGTPTVAIADEYD